MIKSLSSYIQEMDDDGYVPFNADRSLGQNQYASRYVRRVDDPNYPNLGEGFRWKNLDTGSYHDIMIHIDDLIAFHTKVREYLDVIL